MFGALYFAWLCAKTGSTDALLSSQLNVLKQKGRARRFAVLKYCFVHQRSFGRSRYFRSSSLHFVMTNQVVASIGRFCEFESMNTASLTFPPWNIVTGHSYEAPYCCWCNTVRRCTSFRSFTVHAMNPYYLQFNMKTVWSVWNLRAIECSWCTSLHLSVVMPKQTHSTGTAHKSRTRARTRELVRARVLWHSSDNYYRQANIATRRLKIMLIRARFQCIIFQAKLTVSV